MRLISLTEFQELLKWGILMGVSTCCGVALRLHYLGVMSWHLFAARVELLNNCLGSASRELLENDVDALTVLF